MINFRTLTLFGISMLLFFSMNGQSPVKRFPNQQYGRQKAGKPMVVKPSTKTVDIQESKNFEESQPTILRANKTEQPIEKWSLEECVQYATENNLDLSESELTQRMNRLTLEQSKASRWPSLNADISLGNSYGRSIDPTTNQFINAGFLFNNASVNSQVLLFGWFRKKLEIKQNYLKQQASNELYAQLRDNIALNVANGYLRALLAKEQVRVSIEQLNTNQAQLLQTQRFVRAGKLPQLNLEQMQAQVASDSANIISVQTEEQLALLQLRALLNLDFTRKFDIVKPKLGNKDMIASEPLSPNEIYEKALQNQHRIRAQYMNLLAAKKGIEQAESMKYPSLFVGGGLSTSYSSQFQEVTGRTIVGQQEIGSVQVAGLNYPIQTPVYDFSRQTVPYFRQVENNVRSNIALTLSVPIFNGHQVKTNVERAKIGLFNQRIIAQREQQNLQQEIYTASLQATAAQQKFKAAQSAEQSAKRALDFAIKRYNIGMLPTFEYTQTQNNFNQASYNTLSAKYEFLFKQKVLDFYIGNPIKL
jgi:outer membrane protein